MPKCLTCYDTGNCHCGATDCVQTCGGRCSECYCDWCSEKGMEIVRKDDEGKNVCVGCADHYEANCEPKIVTKQDDPHDD